MFQRVTKLFKSADFIGSKVEPTFNSQSQVQSYFGACVSIILLIIGGLGFGFFGKEVITKGTVRSTQSVITLEEASLRLTETPFMMMFRSSDTILNFNQPFRRAVKISARLTQIRTGGEAQIKAVFHEIPIVNCSNVRFHEAAEQRIVHFKLDKRAFLCFDFAALKLPEEEKVIRNSYSAANSNTLVLNIKKCDEKADPGCRTYLDKVMPNFTFTSSIPTYTLDISKYDSPIEFSSKTISSSLTKDFFTGQLLSMDYNKLETDEGWFIDSIKQDEFFTKGNVEYSFGPYEEKDSLLYELLIDAPAVLTKVNRSYVKVQEVLANVGGFMKTLMIISNYLTKGYSEYVFLKRVEAVFEFEEIRKSKKEMNVNNLVLPNQKESAVEMKLKINKFKTGLGVTEMKALDTSVISYLKYFFVNCCKKKNGELEQYLKYIDFKHVFAEIIRIKENLEEIGVTNHQHIPIA